MTLRETDIAGLLVIEPRVHKDGRGYFFESFRASALAEAGITNLFVQDNQSHSSRGVIRGLHFQREPHAQAKLVRVLEGAIFDVALDLRPGSDSFGHWFGIELSSENHLQLYIPQGFAHGFSVLSDTATILYKCDSYYHPASEGGIRFDDPQLAIDWKLDHQELIVSDKDMALPYLKEI